MQAGDITPDGKTVSKVEKIVGVRKMTIANIEQSLKSAPQVSGFTHADVSGVVKLKDKLAEAGHKVSVTEIFVKLIAMALEKHPELNCYRVENAIVQYSSINMGVAVGTKTGMLIVPVIRNCESKSLLEISKEMKEILVKVRENKLSSDMMMGGTFTVSSIGMFGADNADPILNVPQAGIIALGRIQKQAVVDENDNIVIRPKAYLTITVDHAAVNGAPASLFMQTVCEYSRTANEIIPIA